MTSPQVITEPIAAWFKACGIALPLRHRTIRAVLPGGSLLMRTNSSDFAVYARERCRHLLPVHQSTADVTADVFCLTGQTWPMVAPVNASRPLPAADGGFQSFVRDGVICAWQSPALMGSLAAGRPSAVRILATAMRSRDRPRVPGELRLKCDDDTILQSNVFDLVLCLFARARGISLFHGAMLQCRSSGLLLTGDSGCGKTTAALALVRGGFRLHTDEYAVLWRRGIRRGRFGGVLVPQMLAGAPESLDELESTIHNSGAVKQAFSVPTAATGRSPVPVNVVLSLERPSRRPAEHRAVPLEPGELFACLVSALLDPVHGGREDVFDALLAVVPIMRGYRVQIGSNLESLPSFVDGLMQNRSGTPRKHRSA